MVTIEKIKNGYFPNTNYIALYIHNMAERFATTLIEVFTAAYFYDLGMPLHFILLFFGLEFGFRGFFSPLGSMLILKIGFSRSILISYIPLSIFFFMVSMSKFSLFIGFFAFIFHSIARGIYYPCFHALHSIYINNSTRGRQNSLSTILNSLSAIISVSFSVFLLQYFSYYHIATLAIIILGIGTIPLFIYLKDINDFKSLKFYEPYKFLFSKNFRENIIPFIGESHAIIVADIIAALFVFIIVGNFKILGTVVIAALILEAIFVLFFGLYIDKKGFKNSTPKAAFIHSITSFGFIFFIFKPIYAFVVKTYQQITYNMFNNSFTPRVEKKMYKSRNPIIYSSAKEMALCFSELSLLVIYSVIAFFFNKFVFIIIFMINIIALYAAAKYFKD